MICPRRSRLAAVSGSLQQARVDGTLVEAIQKRRHELGDTLPRIALFLFDTPDTESLRFE